MSPIYYVTRLYEIPVYVKEVVSHTNKLKIQIWGMTKVI